MLKKYFIQKVRCNGKKLILVYDLESGVLMAAKTYHFNVVAEAIEPLKIKNYTTSSEELTLQSKDFNFYKKYPNCLQNE